MSTWIAIAAVALAIGLGVLYFLQEFLALRYLSDEIPDPMGSPNELEVPLQSLPLVPTL